MRLFFCVIATILVFVGPLFAQDLPVSTKTLETEHFRIQVEVPWHHKRPAPQETGEILEQFYSVLDRYFGKPIALRKKQTLQIQASDGEPNPVNDQEKDDKKQTAKKPKKTVKPPTEELKSEHEKIAVHFLNDVESYARTVAVMERDEHAKKAGGLYFPGSKKVYLYRSERLFYCRGVLLHETTHAYQDAVFPGSFSGYPQWFREGMALHFDEHLWDGRRLTVDFMPPFSKAGYADDAIPVLRDMITWVRQKHSDEANEPPLPATPEDTKKARKPAKPQPARETVINSALISEYLADRLNGSGLDHNTPQSIEITRKSYGLYWILGKYLFMERRKELVSILSDMSTDPDLVSKTDSQATQKAFDKAFDKAFEKKPMTVEAIGRWLTVHQPKWKVAFGEWQFTNQAFLARAKGLSPEKSSFSVLLYQVPNRIPAFTVQPDQGKCDAGLVLNYVDYANFNTVCVRDSGAVSFMSMVNGHWNSGKNLGMLRPAARSSPDSGKLAFVVRSRGDALEVLINGRSFYQGPQNPGHQLGLLLGGAMSEAEFNVR